MIEPGKDARDRARELVQWWDTGILPLGALKRRAADPAAPWHQSEGYSPRSAEYELIQQLVRAFATTEASLSAGAATAAFDLLERLAAHWAVTGDPRAAINFRFARGTGGIEVDAIFEILTGADTMLRSALERYTEAADYLVSLYKRLGQGGVVRDLQEATGEYDAAKAALLSTQPKGEG